MKIIAFFLPMIFLSCTLSAKEFKLKSPDEKIQLTVSINDEIIWSVTRENKTVVEKAVVGLELSGRTPAEPSLHLRKSEKTIDKVLKPVIPHKDAVIRDHCNELTLHFKNKFKLVFRAYNDGVAYRFADEQEKPTEVLNEKMVLTFPEGSSSWFPQEESMYSHNERFYPYKSLTSIKSGEFCSLPVLFDTPDKIKVLFTETALHNYPCMFLEGNGNNTLQAIYPNYVLETVSGKRGPDRNQTITKEAGYIAKIEGKKEYPWRVFIIGNDKTPVESNLTWQLAKPCALENTNWIKPGKVAWDWYNANNIYGVGFEAGLNTETYKYYIDFASENNIEYVILDEGWTKSTTEIQENNPDIDVKELIGYAGKKDVGIILWVLWKPLNDNLAEILETYSSWGAKGIKVDFMQRSDQYMVNSYEEIAKKAAQLELLVDYHGAFKPSGLRRTYPNIVNYEGVKGSENNKWSADITPEHNVTIPFTRMVAGPMDYTPGCMINAQEINFNISFERPMSLGTRCHQVAMYMVYEAPLQMMCESPSTYKKEQETVDFITRIPTVWDETKVLEAAVGNYIAVARRKGDNWYIGAMTDWTPREFNIVLNFLGEGIYSLEIMKDGLNAHRFAQDYAKESKQVTQESTIKINMAKGGGWAAIIKKQP
ncbi:MAG: glycoside hydrolase family 97 protein [Prolixibacteraceae bacterium]|nr:glycoside hydrolase family 97 protein [Prolixibacteraceae bacterium]